MVVGRRTQQRWSLAGLLGRGPVAASEPDLAASRLAHPSTVPPDAVLLVVEDAHDLAWLLGHTRRSPRGWVPVVAAVARPSLVAAARTAGARAVVPLTEPLADLGDVLRALLAEVAAPAAVINLDAVRSA